ncbi:hypothetical protein ACFXTH_033183 [Malus domestica]
MCYRCNHGHWLEQCSLQEIVPCEATFWIQAHGIHVGRMTAHKAHIIAGRLLAERSGKVDAFGSGLCLWPPVLVASRKVEILATTSLVLGYVWLISMK